MEKTLQQRVRQYNRHAGISSVNAMSPTLTNDIGVLREIVRVILYLNKSDKWFSVHRLRYFLMYDRRPNHSSSAHKLYDRTSDATAMP
ncbi:hypothetical protein HPB50_015587 [Hyalomma asiaticum]|uniref:Uncharacterized protein n=1 Tax=Hyalomma asiaticum TaxID=266040 RepID=A0ACB7RUY3_HYAAI|nr:hypothetical protein HPB50_015587 [Hyalomma asiaticum]